MIIHSVFIAVTAGILFTPSITLAQKKARYYNFYRAPSTQSGRLRHAPATAPAPHVTISPREHTLIQVPQSVRARVPATSSGIGNPSLAKTPMAPNLERLQKYEQERRRARIGHRAIAKRVVFAGGILLLPDVSYIGVPVILDVPEVGEVLVPEEIYAEIYELLSSGDEQAIARAVAWLSQFKRTFEVSDGPTIIHSNRFAPNTVPSDPEEARDYSEPLSFDSAPKKAPNGRERGRAARDRLN